MLSNILDFICTRLRPAENRIGLAIAHPVRFSAERIRVQMKSRILQNTVE